MKEQEHEGYSFLYILTNLLAWKFKYVTFFKFNTNITLFWCYLYCLLLSALTDIFSGVPYAVFLLQKRDEVMQY
jgi:hypothetical protein